jgi:serine/threonine protein kinase
MNRAPTPTRSDAAAAVGPAPAVRALDDPAVERLRRVAAGDDEPPDLTGTRYELAEPIGRGGMGAVYRVRDRELGRDLALKVLVAEQSGAEAGARLLEEARILARLEHPGIVPVHEVGTLPDGRLFYTMRLVHGSRLDRIVGSGAPLEDRLRAFERLCEAVAFAHAHGVIHRDLKPENVMVGAFGEVLVMDWGVAKVRAAPDGGAAPGVTPSRAAPPVADRPLSRDDDFTKGTAAAAPRAGEALPPRRGATAPGAVLGTPGYMAPEQARGDAAAADERSDVHALGAILWFLLSGRAPEASAGAPVAGRGDSTAIPPPIAAVCRKALAADPAERYVGARELADDVRRWLSGLPVAAHREGPLERVARLARRHRTALLLVGAYLVMRLLLGLLAGV